VWVTSSTTTALTPTAIALGNFDGVHRGHQRVVRSILSKPLEIGRSYVERESSAPSESPHATVVTFNPHPREFFTGQNQKLLTPPAEKSEQLKLLGVEQLILLPFDREMAALSPQAFVDLILVEQLRVKHISIGADFRFGYKRSGTAADLRSLAGKYGIDVAIAPLQTSQAERISSSRIRQALQDGHLETANQLLGRPYSLTGTVVIGQQLGRTIGFPTANLKLPENKFLPRYGVYSARVSISTTSDCFSSIPAALNIGCRPTVSGDVALTVEVHLLDWSGDLYGKTLTVNLEQFLRPEQKFSSLDALKAQISRDCQTTRELLKERI